MMQTFSGSLSSSDSDLFKTFDQIESRHQSDLFSPKRHIFPYACAYNICTLYPDPALDTYSDNLNAFKDNKYYELIFVHTRRGRKDYIFCWNKSAVLVPLSLVTSYRPFHYPEYKCSHIQETFVVAKFLYELTHLLTQSRTHSFYACLISSKITIRKLSLCSKKMLC